MNLKDFADFVESLARGDHGLTAQEIADRYEAFGKELIEAAAKVRAQAQQPFRAGGGTGDRCRIQVVGSDGVIKADRFHNWN